MYISGILFFHKHILLILFYGIFMQFLNYVSQSDFQGKNNT